MKAMRRSGVSVEGAGESSGEGAPQALRVAYGGLFGFLLRAPRDAARHATQNPHDECPVQSWGPRCTGGTLAF